MDGMLFRPTTQSASLQVAANDLGHNGAGGPEMASGEDRHHADPHPAAAQSCYREPSAAEPGPDRTIPAATAVVPPVSPYPAALRQRSSQRLRRGACHAARISLNASAAAEPGAGILPWKLPAGPQPTRRSGPASRPGPAGHPAQPVAKGSADLSDVAEGSPLWNDLNAMDQKLMSQITTQELVVGTALTVSTGFTVGYVVWMLRGGMLLTSLLAQMPAWRLLDPLAVLNQTNDFGKRWAAGEPWKRSSIAWKIARSKRPQSRRYSYELAFHAHADIDRAGMPDAERALVEHADRHRAQSREGGARRAAHPLRSDCGQ